MSHTYVLCAYHSHTRCKLVHYVRRIYFPPLYAFYGISYNFGYGKLAHNIHAHKFFNAMHESYSLLPFLGETCQHLYALHTHTHTVRISYMLHVQQTRSTFLQCKNCYSLEHTTRSFPSRNIAFGSCICFEEQFLSCDSLRPIRTYGAINWNLDFFLVSFIDPFPRECF